MSELSGDGVSPEAPRAAPRRHRRVDTGTVRFWERDAELLGFVGEQLTVTVEQLARLTTRNIGTARALRNRWRRAGWVESHPLLWYGPSFLWLTRRGARAVDSPYRAFAPNPGRAAHLAAVTDVRILLERELGLGDWECERALARALPAGRGAKPHLPDAVLEGAGGRVAIEVELSLKSTGRLELILAELSRRYPEVWYFASPPVAPALRRLAARTPWRNVVVHPFPPEPGDLGLARPGG